MSFDPNPQPDASTMMPPETAPFGTVETPKSNKKWWFIGCGGCLLFVVLVCGGGGAFFYFQFVKPAQDFLIESTEIAKESQAVIDVLGSPVDIGAPEAPSTTSSGDQVILEYRFPISGPNASGTLILEALYDMKTWERKQFYIEVDGEKIKIDEDQFDINIDMGDGGDGDSDIE